MAYFMEYTLGPIGSNVSCIQSASLAAVTPFTNMV